MCSHWKNLICKERLMDIDLLFAFLCMTMGLNNNVGMVELQQEKMKQEKIAQQEHKAFLSAYNKKEKNYAANHRKHEQKAFKNNREGKHK